MTGTFFLKFRNYQKSILLNLPDYNRTCTYAKNDLYQYLIKILISPSRNAMPSFRPRVIPKYSNHKLALPLLYSDSKTNYFKESPAYPAERSSQKKTYLTTLEFGSFQSQTMEG
ncbi:hypothetical protein CEXT_44361 [Caerostris extrusa]|uniref:Uncharacterized protein n=1 Tax=Caerostris extrusa TaxID=172846 RepID=A0AAV4XRH3_CAEEX|nr:hypothetical protein CEXT_44361 [Caerostris extrusa]